LGAGYFIAFEGPEGAGKSSQIRLLADTLRATGCDVLVTREPGGTPIGERIRDVLLDASSAAMSPRTEALLLNAARAQLVQDVIGPALERGEVVLCDRFADSTLAYQGGGRGLSLWELATLQQFAIGGLEPDLRILLDVDAEIGLRRRRAVVGSSNRLDEESLLFHRRVRDTFRELARADPGSWIVLDGGQPSETVASEVANEVMSRLRPTMLGVENHERSGSRG
jgi:dTMP kinase